ncbi:MAG: hypothetical protein CEE42_03980 [Promethearchaeota archaeon Loki_b31]|nr:MAG: hypothetical protein CEE42_03980 [Candidatus Lokiarchaeota archaeon Loki_b31]
MLDIVLKQENGYRCIDLGFTKYKLSDELEKIKKMNNKRIILGIRPEDVLISKQNASNSIKAKIDIIEPMGREFEIHLDLGLKTLIAVIRKIESFNIGDEVYLTFNDKKIHLFDKNTEENIFASIYKDKSNFFF